MRIGFDAFTALIDLGCANKEKVSVQKINKKYKLFISTLWQEVNIRDRFQIKKAALHFLMCYLPNSSFSLVRLPALVDYLLSRPVGSHPNAAAGWL